MANDRHARPDYLTAYYLGQHMYTLVPRHVREDMQWMADAGTDAVAIAVLENDLRAARHNMDILCAEAERAGMVVFAIPSRWGGLFAGAPKVPSIFTATHPETWMLDARGKPYMSRTWGPMSSVHHPATYEFFAKALHTLLGEHPFAGLVWDEPKAVTTDDRHAAQIGDFSAAAKAKMPEHADGDWHLQSFADFVDQLGDVARSVRPDAKLSMFLYGHLPRGPRELLAKMRTLDYFGCDGKPWALDDIKDHPAEPELVKALLDHGPGFLDAARATGKGGLMLIENHNMRDWGYAIMDRRLPDVFALGAEHLLYYYYPRNLTDPDRAMGILQKHLRGWGQ